MKCTWHLPHACSDSLLNTFEQHTACAQQLEMTSDTEMGQLEKHDQHKEKTKEVCDIEIKPNPKPAL
jgi:hypothetical protein